MAEIQTFPAGVLDVQIYVDPTTSEVTGMFCLTFMGLTVRDSGDWEPVLRSETNIDETAANNIYAIDWTIDDIPNSEADLSVDLEHPLVEAYDNDTITLDMIKKYCFTIQEAE